MKKDGVRGGAVSKIVEVSTQNPFFIFFFPLPVSVPNFRLQLQISPDRPVTGALASFTFIFFLPFSH